MLLAKLHPFVHGVPGRDPANIGLISKRGWVRTACEPPESTGPG